MAQEIFNGLKNHQKTGTRHIIFDGLKNHQKNNNPRYEVDIRWNIKQNNSQQQNDSQSSPFSFSDGVLSIYFTSEELKGELDLKPFPNLRKITFQNNVQFDNLESIDLSKNENLCKIVMEQTDYQWNPFFHNYNFILLIKEMQIEDRKLEQLETEIAELRQSLNYKDQIITELNKKAQQTPTLSQFRELNNIALGRTDINFNKLMQEIKRLKLKDFNPYFQEQKNTFEQLTATAKNKAGDSLKSILDLFLQTSRQIIESEDKSNNYDSFVQGQLQGQLNTCRTLLQTKFTPEELRSLLDKQKGLRKLEKHS
ncbi:10766_t:CDS:2, partial [Dentiscutata erythropus]